MTPDQLERFLAYLARAHDPEAETQKEPGGDTPTLGDLWNSTKQSKDAPAAPAEPLRKPEGAKATPSEAPAAVPATAPLLGLTEAALVLDCHRRTVRAYIRAGLLPGLLLAGRWKIRREDLEAFIEAAPRARNESKTAVPAARSSER